MTRSDKHVAWEIRVRFTNGSSTGRNLLKFGLQGARFGPWGAHDPKFAATDAIASRLLVAEKWCCR